VIFDCFYFAAASGADPIALVTDMWLRVCSFSGREWRSLKENRDPGKPENLSALTTVRRFVSARASDCRGRALSSQQRRERYPTNGTRRASTDRPKPTGLLSWHGGPQNAASAPDTASGDRKPRKKSCAPRYRLFGIASQSDDALYLTVGQVRERFGGISAMWVVRRMVNAGFLPDQFRPLKIRTTVLEVRRHLTKGNANAPASRGARHEQT
jgi:hypothetical protein